MATPNLTDALIEFTFTPEELIGARILDANKQAYYRTLYAKLFKQRGSILIPSGKELEGDYIKQCCEIDGKLAMLQELMDGHTEALNEFNKRKQEAEVLNQDPTDVAKRAAQQVHEIKVL